MNETKLTTPIPLFFGGSLDDSYLCRLVSDDTDVVPPIVVDWAILLCPNRPRSSADVVDVLQLTVDELNNEEIAIATSVENDAIRLGGL